MATILDIGQAVDDLGAAGLDACTLNNALNIAQLVVLVALLRWVRADATRP
jgi:hypothetical protein